MLKIENNTALLAMPAEVRLFTLQNCVAASPYNRSTSGSFYNTTEKSWDYTPEGAIRVSDHWNFYSRGNIHCITNIDNSLINNKWVVAQYSQGVWNVICADDKDETAFNKHYSRIKNKTTPVVASEIRVKRMQKLAQIREQRRKLAREKKIKANTLWVMINVNVWSGSGRRVRFAGTETIIGRLVYESKSGVSCIIKMENGSTREFRKYNSYKELDRKPAIFYAKKAGK